MATSNSRLNPTVVRPRIFLAPDLILGPGKIDLLRAVAQSGSISGAARNIGISYKRAWVLIDTLNQGFGQPVVHSVVGGHGGGGASLTPLGEAVVHHYLRMESSCQAAVRPDIAALKRLLTQQRS